RGISQGFLPRIDRRSRFGDQREGETGRSLQRKDLLRALGRPAKDQKRCSAGARRTIFSLPQRRMEGSSRLLRECKRDRLVPRRTQKSGRLALHDSAPSAAPFADPDFALRGKGLPSEPRRQLLKPSPKGTETHRHDRFGGGLIYETRSHRPPCG